MLHAAIGVSDVLSDICRPNRRFPGKNSLCGVRRLSDTRVFLHPDRIGDPPVWTSSRRRLHGQNDRLGPIRRGSGGGPGDGPTATTAVPSAGRFTATCSKPTTQHGTEMLARPWSAYSLPRNKRTFRPTARYCTVAKVLLVRNVSDTGVFLANGQTASLKAFDVVGQLSDTPDRRQDLPSIPADSNSTPLLMAPSSSRPSEARWPSAGNAETSTAPTARPCRPHSKSTYVPRPVPWRPAANPPGRSSGSPSTRPLPGPCTAGPMSC